jgi:hypothetical protein
VDWVSLIGAANIKTSNHLAHLSFCSFALQIKDKYIFLVTITMITLRRLFPTPTLTLP